MSQAGHRLFVERDFGQPRTFPQIKNRSGGATKLAFRPMIAMEKSLRNWIRKVISPQRAVWSGGSALMWDPFVLIARESVMGFWRDYRSVMTR